MRQEILNGIERAASNAKEREKLLSRLSFRSSSYSERQIRPHLAPMVEEALSSAHIDERDIATFCREHGLVEKQVFVDQVKRRLFEIFDRFYGIHTSDLSVSSVAELAMHSVHLLSTAISSGRVTRISRSHSDLLRGDLVITKIQREPIPEGCVCQIKDLEHQGEERVCFVEPVQRSGFSSDVCGQYLAEELSSVFPLILSRYSKNPAEAAGRVMGKLLRIIYREMLEREIEKRLFDCIVESGLIFEDPYNAGRYFVNRLEGYRLGNMILSSAYANPSLYSSPNVILPPSERKPYVLGLELATGCDYNRCTYCGLYKGVKHHVKNVDEFERHFRDVVAELQFDREFVKRVFIGGGNALAAGVDELVEVLDLVRRYLPNTKRISMFGRADTIMKKGAAGLSQLKKHGLALLYVGAESGSQEVLDYVEKRASVADVRIAAEMMMTAEIELSIMIMPGLGGLRFFHQQARESANLLNEIAPRFVTLMSVNADPASEYALRMNGEVRQGVNRPLTDNEVVQQVRNMIACMTLRGSMKVAMHDKGIDQVACNPVTFEAQFDESGRQEIIEICDCFLSERDPALARVLTPLFSQNPSH